MSKREGAWEEGEPEEEEEEEEEEAAAAPEEEEDFLRFVFGLKVQPSGLEARIWWGVQVGKGFWE